MTLVDFDHISQNVSKRKYRLIGSGSGRLVFDLDNGYVVKVAKNRKGVAQNKAEYKIASMNNTDLFAEISAISDNYNYLIMEKADKIKSIAEIWDYYQVRSNHELFKLDNFKDIGMKYNLLYGDLCRKSSWGFVNKRPKIIDYGFTKETKKYYSLF